MSEEVALLDVGSTRRDEDVPLAEWLTALSHDSPYEQPQGRSPRTGNPPPLSMVPSLLSLLEDKSASIRHQVVTALGDLAREVRRVLPEIRNALTQTALHDNDNGIRTEAVRALLHAGPQANSEVGALIDSLHSDIAILRCHAASALGDYGTAGRQAVPDLIHASLWDEEPAVHVAAAMALWRIDDNRDTLAVYYMIKALDDPNELICWVAAENLKQLGAAAREAVPALQRALQREFRLSLVRKAVKLAPERISYQAPALAG
jgi:HEAT repeat protein